MVAFGSLALGDEARARMCAEEVRKIDCADFSLRLLDLLLCGEL